MLKVVKLNPDAIVPTRGSEEAAGLDFHSTIDTVLPAGGQVMIPTGIGMSIPKGYVALVWPRSKLANKHSLDTLAGVVDSDYRGEVHIILFNHSDEDFIINKGDKLSQVLIQPVMLWEPTLVEDLDETKRGDAGINCEDLRV